MVLLYIAILLLLFILYGAHRFILDMRYKLPPGPTPVPFFGNALIYFKCKRNWVIFREHSKTYGPVTTFYVGQFRVITLNSPKVIQEVIVSQSKIFSDRPLPVMPGFDNYPFGVIFQSGKKWQHGRRFCLKALRDFGMGKMAMVEKIHEELGFFLDELERRSLRPFKPRNFLTNTVSNVICSLVFGKRFDYDDPAFVVLMGMMQDIAARPFSREFSFFMFPLLRFFRSPKAVSLAWATQRRVKEMLTHALKEHRTDFHSDNIRDFPDMFIASELAADEDAMDLESFTNMMGDMFLAGSETTSTLLNWTLLYLSKFPAVQSKCHESIDRVIGGSNRLPVLTDRPDLVYIDAVMCEVQRMASIVPLSLFHCNLSEPGTISGYDIPPGSLIAYNTWALHYDQTYWPEPEKFNPDRWIDANGKLLSHSTHFMPFGTGPRTCLGENLARVEFFIFTVALLQRFNFSVEDPSLTFEDGLPGATYSPPDYKLIATKR